MTNARPTYVANTRAERMERRVAVGPAKSDFSSADSPPAITLSAELRSTKVTPHVARHEWRPFAIDGAPATPLTGASESASMKRSAESRSPGRRRPSAAATASGGPSHSVPPPKIWCDCRSCWGCRHDRAVRLVIDWPLTDHRGRNVGSRPHDHNRSREPSRDRLWRPTSQPRQLQPLNGLLSFGQLRRDGRSSPATAPLIEITFENRGGDEAMLKGLNVILCRTCQSKSRHTKSRTPRLLHPSRLPTRRTLGLKADERVIRSKKRGKEDKIQAWRHFRRAKLSRPALPSSRCRKARRRR